MRVHTLAKMPSILLSFHPGKNSNTMMLTTISTARVTWNFCILFILIVFRSITFLSLSICCCKDRQKYQIWQTIGQKTPCFAVSYSGRTDKSDKCSNLFKIHMVLRRVKRQSRASDIVCKSHRYSI